MKFCSRGGDRDSVTLALCCEGGSDTTQPRTRSGSSFEGGRPSQTEHFTTFHHVSPWFHDVMLHDVPRGQHRSCVSDLNISNQYVNFRPVGMSGLSFLDTAGHRSTV